MRWPGAILASMNVVILTNLAEPKGLASATSLANGKPVQATAMLQASTQRWR